MKIKFKEELKILVNNDTTKLTTKRINELLPNRTPHTIQNKRIKMLCNTTTPSSSSAARVSHWKNLNTGLVLNKWYVLLLYVNMDRAIIQRQPCVQKKDIGYFLFVKCPSDTKYIYIYFYNGHSLYILIGVNKYQLMVW